jgi:hypothetical protein
LRQLAEAREAAAKFRATSGRDVREHAKRASIAWNWLNSRLARIEPDG